MVEPGVQVAPARGVLRTIGGGGSGAGEADVLDVGLGVEAAHGPGVIVRREGTGVDDGHAEPVVAMDETGPRVRVRDSASPGMAALR